MDKLVYLDNNATTKMNKEVVDAMLPYMTDYFGNASSHYSIGYASKKALDNARNRVAELLKVSPEEIIFTASGSEANNMAIKGIANSLKNKGKHIITSKIEHPAILNTCKFLESEGFQITYLSVGATGIIDLEELELSIRKDTILISIMTANNEIGAIQPIKQIGKIAENHNVLFHTDAVQAMSNVDINIYEDKISMLSMSGHKIHGPKGIGLLFVKQGLDIESLIHGGGQENKRRAGTENLAGIIGLVKALEISLCNPKERLDKIMKNRDYLKERILKEIPNVQINGDIEQRLVNNLNVSFGEIDGAALMAMLDCYGICVSTGSACSSGSSKPSTVLTAIGLSERKAFGSIRMSLDENITKEDIDYVMIYLPTLVDKLRNMSMFYID